MTSSTLACCNNDNVRTCFPERCHIHKSHVSVASMDYLPFEMRSFLRRARLLRGRAGVFLGKAMEWSDLSPSAERGAVLTHPTLLVSSPSASSSRIFQTRRLRWVHHAPGAVLGSG